MTSDLIEPVPHRGMTPGEQTLATEIYEAIQYYSRCDDRGMQSAEYRVGISDLGFCSERTRRMLSHQDPDDSDLLPAFLGTAIGDHLERAMQFRWPEAKIQTKVVVPLYGEGGIYNITGHPDIVFPEGMVLDGKTTRGLEVVRRKGPSQQQQFQRHCYAKGAWLAKMFDDDVALEDVVVGNVWVDRAGDDKEVHVQTEPYSELIVEAATMWLDEVVYNWQHEQEARKEPPREMCAKVCGFYSTCRQLDTDVEGLLSDDTVLAAVDMYQEGKELMREGKRLQDQAKGNIPQSLQGSTGEFAVRWVWVNGSHVEFDREGYHRLDVRKVK